MITIQLNIKHFSITTAFLIPKAIHVIGAKRRCFPHHTIRSSGTVERQKRKQAKSIHNKSTQTGTENKTYSSGMSIPSNTLCLELQSIGVNIDGTRGTIADSSGRSNNLVNWKTGVCGQTLVHLTACIGCLANRLCAMKHNAHTWLHRFLSTTTKRERKKNKTKKKH